MQLSCQELGTFQDLAGKLFPGKDLKELHFIIRLSPFVQLRNCTKGESTAGVCLWSGCSFGLKQIKQTCQPPKTSLICYITVSVWSINIKKTLYFLH